MIFRPEMTKNYSLWFRANFSIWKFFIAFIWKAVEKKKDSYEADTVNNNKNIIWSWLLKLHLIIATIEWNLAHRIFSLNKTRNWVWWRISWLRNTNTQSCIWKRLLENCNLRVSAEPQKASNLPEKMCLESGWISSMESSFCDTFLSDRHYFLKKFL